MKIEEEIREMFEGLVSESPVPMDYECNRIHDHLVQESLPLYDDDVKYSEEYDDDDIISQFEYDEEDGE